MAFQNVFTLAVITALLCHAGSAQTGAANPAPSSPAQPVVEEFKILILEGSGATNNLQTRQATPPVVEVNDANDHPVEGAEVIFRLPATGPSGSFANEQLTQTVKTNYQGQATVTGYVPNTQAGKFAINVTATLGNRMGRGTIAQTNSPNKFLARPPQHSGVKKKWIIIGSIVAAVGTTVGVLLTR